jgi:hypothetical protein
VNLLGAVGCKLLFFIEIGSFCRLNFVYTLSHFGVPLGSIPILGFIRFADKAKARSGKMIRKAVR